MTIYTRGKCGCDKLETSRERAIGQSSERHAHCTAPSNYFTTVPTDALRMAEWALPAPQRVVFCTDCGTLMEEPTFANTNVLCRMCGTIMPSKGAALTGLATSRVRSTDPSASAQYLRSWW